MKMPNCQPETACNHLPMADKFLAQLLVYRLRTAVSTSKNDAFFRNDL